MNRTKLNALIDGLALVSFLFLTSTGFLLKFKLPPHSRDNTVWGYTRHQWGEIHTWISFLLIFFLIFHLLLHWKWIVAVVKGKAASLKRFRLSLVSVSLLILGVFAVSPFVAPVVGSEGQGDGRRFYGQQEGQYKEAPVAVMRIKGSTTLAQIEEATGVTPSELLSSLNIPVDQSFDSKVGPLCRQHGVEMSRLRQAVEELQKP